MIILHFTRSGARESEYWNGQGRYAWVPQGPGRRIAHGWKLGAREGNGRSDGQQRPSSGKPNEESPRGIFELDLEVPGRTRSEFPRICVLLEIVFKVRQSNGGETSHSQKGCPLSR